MLVVTRFRVAQDRVAAFRVDLESAHALLATQAGYLHGSIGRNVDDPELWVLTTSWETVGAYRRALSSYDVKVGVVPLLSLAVDEPSAYELVEPGTSLNRSSARGDAGSSA